MSTLYFATDLLEHFATARRIAAKFVAFTHAAAGTVAVGGGGGGGGNQSVMAWHAATVLPLDIKPANIATTVYTWMLCHQGNAFEVTRFG